VAHSFPAHTAAGAAGAGVEPPKSNDQRDPSRPAISENLQRDITRHQYAQEHILQSYDLYVPELDSPHLSDTKSKIWILYIHGGYFRDPTVSSSSFYPALARLVATKAKSNGRHLHHVKHHMPSPDETDITPCVAGYASINYRLSPDPQKSPQDPASTSGYELRTAKWPDHLHDVLTAIAHLQAKYGFGERYLLVGHSVGATMALLSTIAAKEGLTTSPSSVSPLPRIEPPLAVLGVSGIYDFPALHESVSSYVELTRNAIPDVRDDKLASPARHKKAEYIDVWAQGRRRALVMAHSKDDGWVDWRQVEEMRDVFAQVEDSASTEIDLRIVELNGSHNDIWEKGTELARAIRESVAILRSLED